MSDFVIPDALTNSSFSQENRRRRLSDMSWKERRDQLIAALDLIASRNQSDAYFHLPVKRASALNTPSVSKKFLEYVGIDIIDNTLLPHDEMFRLASFLPCLESPPERDAYRYPKALPNDYDRSRQWYFGPAPGVDIENAWTCYNGHSNGMVVAVLDTGCSRHPDFEKNLCSCADQDCGSFDAVYGKNPFKEVPVSLHGTSVSSIIAADTNNGYGIAGVCWSCRIMCIKAADDIHGHFRVSYLVDGINYMLRKKVKLSNHSYGGFGENRAELRAFMDLEAAGHLAIIAAGNEHCNIDKPGSRDPDACVNPKTGAILGLETPAGYDLSNFITVGATDRNSQKSSYSNYGKKKVHIMAPGSLINVLANTKYASPSKFATGTSYSTPIVAGFIALLWGQNPALTYHEVREIVFNTVTKVEALTNYCRTGGILNAGLAMAEVAKRVQCSKVSTAIVDTPTSDRTLEFDSFAPGCGVSQQFNSSKSLSLSQHFHSIIFLTSISCSSFF